jgi:hypothetical protein
LFSIHFRENTHSDTINSFDFVVRYSCSEGNANKIKGFDTMAYRNYKKAINNCWNYNEAIEIFNQALKDSNISRTSLDKLGDFCWERFVLGIKKKRFLF